jgi:hypothetical protein
VPGLSNLKEKLSFVSIPPDLNNPVSLITLCGSSSMLAHVTVEPALTVNEFGINMNSLITIRVESEVPAVDGAQAPTIHNSAMLTVANHDRYRPAFICVLSLVQ